ncbi:MBL fold metallo-hydrolase [Bradyrhizobium retamae]|uniref:Metallo-beta-lactamase domain-containing protein n=1 Tax=Bradyrhizobium retamae TaxID=1300035 RepID=A0A0R3MIL4_9BRAD|nr:MBL fold metallo-hydrolase [Bradyrhizobium retamae]KRR17637.1 hypothetical protein CQ13_36105 [Bradyrhizobium retamae]
MWETAEGQPIAVTGLHSACFVEKVPERRAASAEWKENMRIGSVEIVSLIDGEVEGSAEAMYPTAPAGTWERNKMHLNRLSGKLLMSVGAYLLRFPNRLALIDCGNGPNPKPPFRGGALRSSIASQGVDPEEISDVIFTHLHFDHIGWATHEGKPSFPNATFHCNQLEWEYNMREDYEPQEFEIRSANPQDLAHVRLAPIRDRFRTWSGTDTGLPGMTTIPAPGHSVGSCAIILESEGERCAFLGDVAHSIPALIDGLRFPINENSDQAMESLYSIRSFLAQEGIPCSASHFPGLCWGKVVRNGSEYRWAPIG